jgi:phospholipid/cholesterol/gamma-HCH transport system substrate-binding protein
MSTKKQFLLGLFFLTALSVLGFYTLFLTDFRLFGEPERMLVRFPQANALREGDPVLVWGMRIGRVAELEIDASAPLEERVRVTLNLERPLELNEDYRIEIQDSSFLGGHQVYIDPGTLGGPTVAPDTKILGQVQKNALEEVGELLARNGEAFGTIVENLDHSLADLRAGRGLLGRLMTDEALASSAASAVDSFEGAVADVREITRQVRSGQGDLGRLVYDNALHDQATTLIANLTTLTDDLRAGKGVAGRLLQDEELGAEIDAAVRSVAAVAKQLEEGDGLLGELLADGQLSDDALAALANLRQASDDIAAVTGTVRSGEGTVGRLLMSQELYDEALVSVKLLTRSLEDFRESVPISTFTSAIFGAF